MQEEYVARWKGFWTSQRANTMVSKTAAKRKAANGEIFDYLSKEKTNGDCQDLRKLRGQPNRSFLPSQHHCAVHLREPFDPSPVSMC